MEQKTCRIAPYEKERWDWLLSAVLIPFMLMCFCMNTDWELPWWVYVGVLILACLGFGKARIRQRGVELFLSDKGIQVCNGGQETVGLTPWSAFDAGYILSIVWYGDHSRHVDTYFLLSGNPLNKDTLDRIAFDLQTEKPCGIWKEYIAVKTGKEHNNAIRTAIGSRVPLKELRIDTCVYDEIEE